MTFICNIVNKHFAYKKIIYLYLDPCRLKLIQKSNYIWELRTYPHNSKCCIGEVPYTLILKLIYWQFRTLQQSSDVDRSSLLVPIPHSTLSASASEIRAADFKSGSRLDSVAFLPVDFRLVI